jgi:hypothetical protein
MAQIDKNLKRAESLMSMLPLGVRRRREEGD